MNHPNPCASHGSFENFKISASDFSTAGMRKQFCTCACEFLTTVTEGVVHSVCKVVTRFSFGVTRRHKVSFGICHMSHVLPHVRPTATEGELRLMEVAFW